MIMNSIKIPLHTKLVSVNRRLRINKNRCFLDKRYRDTKQILIYEFSRLQCKIVSPYKITIHINNTIWRGDIDNCIKILLDVLQISTIIDNDKNITSLHIERIAKTEESYIEIKTA